ncbi:unnamed protein product [Spirodela intermedia]|uniref:Uncharacterized protein n=1 Tax=Spirodela intermedia TaxID=51605 RepID=A0A7I8IVM0_SPIIN|nr:unnamed protein product [Spirodela intermedia]CAA6662037.1 unnamed protein product [Spirodela intermedia]
MAAAGDGEAPSRRPPTPEEIVLLAKSSAAALPCADSHANLLERLLPSSPSVPFHLYVSSLLTLVSRTDPSPPLLFHLFSLHLSTLDRAQLFSVLDEVLSDLSEVSDSEDALPLDLIPRCLDLLVATSGDEVVDSILDRILDADWSKAVLVKVVSLLREFPVSTRIRAMEFLEKAFGGLEGIDIQDLPSLAYQLLLLATKGFNKRAVLSGILSFFGSGTVKGAPAILRQVEGTVLMHFNFAVKQDPSLGKEVMGVLRCDMEAFNHFAVAVLLSIARVRRFNENSIHLLRSLAIKSYSEYRFARDCKWLPTCIKEECLRTAKCIEKSLMRAINENNSGREYIVPSSVQLGFILLESVDGKSCGRSDDSGERMGAEELGIQILKTIFEVHDMARNEIVEQCKFRILSLKPQESSSIIKLLGTLIQSYPYPMLEQNGRLKDLLDYFTFMHDRPAHSLIAAMLPLIRFSRDLQDYIILVVRKAMFRKEDTVRLAATNAVVDLILLDARSKRNCLNSFQESSSQASCSQQTDMPSKIGLPLFQELSGLLKRCLSQQGKIKEVIYGGLVKLVLLDPLLSGAVFDLLWPHFLHFYREDAKFPLVIDSCITEENGKAYVREPLDCLLSCISWILLLQPRNGRESSDYSWTCFGFSLSQDNEVLFQFLFLKCFKKIRHALTYDLKGVLGLINENISHSLQGERKRYCLQILCGIVEVFANVVATELEKAGDAEKTALEKQIVDLSILYNSFQSDISSPKQVDGLRRRGPSRTSAMGTPNFKECSDSFHMRRTFLATASIHQLLATAVKLYDAFNPDGHAVSQDNTQSSAHKTLTCSLGLDSNRWGYEIVGRPLLRLIRLLKMNTKSEDPKKKEVRGKKNSDNIVHVLHLSLKCLDELFKVCLRKEAFVGLIEDMVAVPSGEWSFEIGTDAAGPESGAEEDLPMDTPHARNLLMQSLFRESEVLSDMVLMIGNRLPGVSREPHGIWAVDICKSSGLRHPTAAGGVVAVAIHLRSPPGDLITAQEMASELAAVIGTEEDQGPVEASETYPIINRSTGATIASSLLRLADSVIVDLDWSLSKLKALTTDKIHRSTGLPLEEALYSRSTALVNLLSHFAQMNLKDCQAEQFLKLAARFYKIMSLATKLRIAPRGFEQLPPGGTFQELTEVTCMKLTAPLYGFLAAIQQNQRQAAGGRGLSGRIKRENKWVPDLVFRIEDYEKYLIQLSRLTGVNLLRRAKRSTARDFKILDAMKANRREGEDNAAVPTDSGGGGGEGSQEDDEREKTDEDSTPELGCGEASQSEEDRGDLLDGNERVKRWRAMVVRSSDDEEA